MSQPMTRSSHAHGGFDGRQLLQALHQIAQNRARASDAMRCGGRGGAGQEAVKRAGEELEGGARGLHFFWVALAQHVVEGNEEVVAAGRGWVRRGGSESQKVEE